MGDVLNTTDRIEEACKKYNAGLPVSEELMNKRDLPEKLLTKKGDNEILRGKTEQIGLMEVKAG